MSDVNQMPDTDLDADNPMAYLAFLNTFMNRFADLVEKAIDTDAEVIKKIAANGGMSEAYAALCLEEMKHNAEARKAFGQDFRAGMGKLAEVVPETMKARWYHELEETKLEQAHELEMLKLRQAHELAMRQLEVQASAEAPEAQVWSAKARLAEAISHTYGEKALLIERALGVPAGEATLEVTLDALQNLVEKFEDATIEEREEMLREVQYRFPNGEILNTLMQGMDEDKLVNEF